MGQQYSFLVGMGTDPNLNYSLGQTFPSSGTWTGGLQTRLLLQTLPKFSAWFRGSGQACPHCFWVALGTLVHPRQSEMMQAHGPLCLHHFRLMEVCQGSTQHHLEVARGMLALNHFRSGGPWLRGSVRKPVCGPPSSWTWTGKTWSVPILISQTQLTEKEGILWLPCWFQCKKEGGMPASTI